MRKCSFSMLNRKLICKIFGSLLLLEAMLMTPALAIAIVNKGNDMLSFTVAILVTSAAGGMLRQAGRH